MQRRRVKSTFCTVSRGFKLGIVHQLPTKTTTNEQFPRSTCCIRVFCHNTTQLCRRMTPTYYCSTLNETLFERKCLARFLSDQDKKTKSEPGRRRHHDSPPPEQQEFASLLTVSFANPAVRTELLSSTNVCRQLRHRRLPLLESLLQMKILPPV